MKIAMLSPIARRIPPRDYAPRETVVSLLTEGLLERGLDVTLFATADSSTRARLVAVCPRGCLEDPELPAQVWESLHFAEIFERAGQFDLVHNHCGEMPLTYLPASTTPVLTTVHSTVSDQVLPVYRKYNSRTCYVAVSRASRRPELEYTSTIPYGIAPESFAFRPEHGEYLLFWGRIGHEEGAGECIEVARQSGKRLILTGPVADANYFEARVRPYLDGERIVYLGDAVARERDALLSGALALLCPGSGDEPFPLAVIEAMACGTPVVAARRGSLPELVSHGTTGFLVRDAGEMVAALADVARLDRRQCRRWVEERFSLERMIEDYFRLYTQLLRQSRREDRRPWGFYEVLSDAADHKVKRITVYPGQRLSYQRHFRRSEHWYLLTGQAVATRDGQEIELDSGQAVDIPARAWHRIHNPGAENLVFIEVQTGDYFGEDDIERSEDDYGRVQERGPGEA